MDSGQLQSFFDRAAPVSQRWIWRNRYYHSSILDFMRFHIPSGSTVLEVGCGNGWLLNALKPKKGVGIDFSKGMVEVARKRYPHLEFRQADAHYFKLKGTFDYVVISDTLGYFQDIQQVLANLRQNINEDTRVIITSYNFLWEPVLNFCSLAGLKMRQPFNNWLGPQDIENLLRLENYDVVKTGSFLIFPKYFPLVSKYVNRYVARLPGIRKANLVNFIVARGIFPRKERSVSIVIPARNEAGNIENALKRMPRFGKRQEIIFIEGGSSDNTYDEIRRVAKKYKQWDIKYSQH